MPSRAARNIADLAVRLGTVLLCAYINARTSKEGGAVAKPI